MSTLRAQLSQREAGLAVTLSHAIRDLKSLLYSIVLR